MGNNNSTTAPHCFQRLRENWRRLWRSHVEAESGRLHVEAESGRSHVEAESGRPHVEAVGFSTIADPSTANLDLVFVHGPQGHPEKTWTTNKSSLIGRQGHSKQEAVFWPLDLLSKHPILKNVRILTWGYNTQIDSFFGFSERYKDIRMLADDLVVALGEKRKENPTRPLIFVAHSLGGMLVKVLLLQTGPQPRRDPYLSSRGPDYLPIYQSTRGIIFLGTPHRAEHWMGLMIDLAKLALQIPNEMVREIQQHWTGGYRDFLEHIAQRFPQMLNNGSFHIHSFYETKGMTDKQREVLPRNFATVGASCETAIGINANHLEICKFSVDSDLEYQKVLGAIEDYVKKQQGSEAV